MCAEAAARLQSSRVPLGSGAITYSSSVPTVLSTVWMGFTRTTTPVTPMLIPLGVPNPAERSESVRDRSASSEPDRASAIRSC